MEGEEQEGGLVLSGWETSDGGPLICWEVGNECGPGYISKGGALQQEITIYSMY